jgi:hypothetical protein
MTHKVADIHFPYYRAGLPAWAECDCGVRVEAMPDLILDDPWQTLSEAWTRHKGITPGRGNTPHLPRAEAEVAGGRKAAAVHRAKVAAFR